MVWPFIWIVSVRQFEWIITTYIWLRNIKVKAFLIFPPDTTLQQTAHAAAGYYDGAGIYPFTPDWLPAESELGLTTVKPEKTGHLLSENLIKYSDI